MQSMNQLRMFISMFAINLPTLIVCLVALIVLLTKWRQASQGAMWATLGFGLALVLCFTIPVVQMLLQTWIMKDGNPAARVWVFSVVSGFWSMLHGVVYLLLLTAVFAGRAAPSGAAVTPTPAGDRPGM